MFRSEGFLLGRTTLRGDDVNLRATSASELEQVTDALHDGMLRWGSASRDLTRHSLVIPVEVWTLAESGTHFAAGPIAIESWAKTCVNLEILGVQTVEIEDATGTGTGPLSTVEYDAQGSVLTISADPTPLLIRVRVERFDISVVDSVGCEAEGSRLRLRWIPVRRRA